MSMLELCETIRRHSSLARESDSRRPSVSREYLLYDFLDFLDPYFFDTEDALSETSREYLSRRRGNDVICVL